MLRILLLLLTVYSLDAASAQQTLTRPSDISKLLPGSNLPEARVINPDNQLILAENELVAGDTVAANNRLNMLAKHWAPKPAWYVLKSRASASRIEASKQIAAGYKAYPFSPLMGRYAGALAIAEGRATTRQQILALGLHGGAGYATAAILPSMRLDTSSVIGVRSWLDLERAWYQDGLPVLDAAMQSMHASLYANDIEDNDFSLVTLAERNGTPLDKAYIECLAYAHQKANAVDSAAHSRGSLNRAALVRTITIRRFAQQGYLAKFPEPLLVDLHVLEQAGHLEASSAEMLSVQNPSLLNRYEAQHRGKVESARRYRERAWSEDVDRLLQTSE